MVQKFKFNKKASKFEAFWTASIMLASD